MGNARTAQKGCQQGIIRVAEPAIEISEGHMQMKKLVAVTLSTLALSIAGVTPVFAGDNPVKQVLMFPVKIAAFGAGAVVGTPIAIVRTSAKNTKQSTKDMGGEGSAVKTGLLSIVALPLGVFTGTLEGSYYGLSNATMHTDKPFCKEAFSLGELGDD